MYGGAGIVYASYACFRISYGLREDGSGGKVAGGFSITEISTMWNGIGRLVELFLCTIDGKSFVLHPQGKVWRAEDRTFSIDSTFILLFLYTHNGALI